MKAIHHLSLISCLLISASASAACLTAGISQQAPDHRYTATENGGSTVIVQDNRTGLNWKACAEQAGSPTICSSSPTTLSDWQSALQAADGLTYEGQTGWRLPTVKELTSIIDVACNNPAINSTLFANVVAGSYYTSSSVQEAPTGRIWVVDLTDGSVSPASQGTAAYTLLVKD